MRMTDVVVAGGRRLVGACLVALVASGLCAGAAQAAGVSGQGTWETTLQGRDLDGNTANGFEAYYDTALNITWLADANYAKTSGYDVDGRMNWAAAKTWADNLVVGAYSDWRLPTMVDTGTAGCNLSYAGGTDCGLNVQTKDAVTGKVYSEMAHMYYVTLGNKGYTTPGTGAYPQSGWGLTNTAQFKNVQSSFYWSGVEYASFVNGAWYFVTYDGYQDGYPKDVEFSAWAVRPGDVAAAVPEPETYALALAGFAMAGVALRRRAA